MHQSVALCLSSWRSSVLSSYWTRELSISLTRPDLLDPSELQSSAGLKSSGETNIWGVLCSWTPGLQTPPVQTADSVWRRTVCGRTLPVQNSCGPDLLQEQNLFSNKTTGFVVCNVFSLHEEETFLCEVLQFSSNHRSEISIRAAGVVIRSRI